MKTATGRPDIRALIDALPDLSGSSSDELLAYRRERLTALLRDAVAGSAYYRDLLDGRDPAAVDLADLPTLPKATMMAELDRIVTDPALSSPVLERHLAGRPTELLLDRYHVFTTSGTSGLRGLFVYERGEFATFVAAALRGLMRAGVSPETRLAAIGAPGAVHITRQLFGAFVAGREGTPRLTVTMPVADLVAALNDYRPEAILTYAGIGGLLAEEQLQGRLRIEPQIVIVGSEVLTEDAAERMEQAWGFRPGNVYAATEAPFMAVTSPEGGDVLLVNEEIVVVEAVDADNRPVPPGAPSAKVLLTNLVNRAQPLIRYELADSVTLAEPAGPGDPPSLRIARVDGRSDDVLRLPARGGGEVDVYPFRLRAPFARLADVVQYQVVQEERGLRARVVLRPGAARDSAAAVEVALAEALAEAGAEVPVTVEPVGEIAREPGDGAKVKLVVARAA